MGKYVAKFSFDLRLETVAIFFLDLLWSEVEFDSYLSVEFEVKGDIMVQSLTLSEGLVKMEKLDHVYPIGLLKQEDFVNVLEHDLVIMRLAV